MGVFSNILKPAVAAAALSVALVTSAVCQDTDATMNRLDKLMMELKLSTPEEAARISADIALEWQRSGSATADLLLSRGQKSLEAGRIESALEHFTALTDHAPAFAEGWYSRAGAFARLERYGQALDDLRTVLDLNPEHFEAMIGLAAIFERIGRPKEAYEAYQLVTAIHPHHPAVTEALKRLEPLVVGRKL